MVHLHWRDFFVTKCASLVRNRDAISPSNRNVAPPKVPKASAVKVRLHRRFGLAISLSDVISIFQFSLKSHCSAKLLAPHRLCKVVFTQVSKQLRFLAGNCDFNENWKIEITSLSEIANPNRLCKWTLSLKRWENSDDPKKWLKCKV